MTHTLADILKMDVDEFSRVVSSLQIPDRISLVEDIVGALTLDRAEGVRLERLIALARTCVDAGSPGATTHTLQQLVTLVLDVSDSTSDAALAASALSLTALVVQRHPLAPHDVVDLVVSAALSLSDPDGRTRFQGSADYLADVATDVLASSQVVASRARHRRSSQSQPIAGVLPDLNFDRAAETVESDAAADWYEDPWEWPEFEHMRSAPGTIANRLASAFTAKTVPIDVPKEGGGTRPAVILDCVDLVAAQSLVDLASVSLVGDLPGWVFGWRLDRDSPAPGDYVHDGVEWRDREAYRAVLSGEFKWVLELDVSEFFASVPVPRMYSGLTEFDEIPAPVVDRLGQFLFDWDQQPGRRGIPQRSRVSAVLAQRYLRPIDQLLLRRERWGQKCVRWMDDITVFGNSRAELVETAQLVEQQLYSLGLTLNGSKCSLLSTDASPHHRLEELLQDIAYSEVDYDGNVIVLDDEIDPYVLAEVANEIIDLGEKAPRNAIKFAAGATARLHKAHPDKSDPSRLIESRENLMQGADALADLTLSTEQWEPLQSWYVDWLAAHPVVSNWTSYAWGRMLSPTAVASDVADFISNSGLHTLPAPMIPLACNRLVAWRGNNALEVLRPAAALARDAFSIRSIAIAAAQCGAHRDEWREWLGGYPETTAALGLLEPYLSTPRDSV